MKSLSDTGQINMVPVDKIDVLNPRERNQKIFDEVVENIKAIGLKKPITVTPRKGTDGSDRFLLICGEGRLKAFKVLGETHIPALVRNESDENALIMSLAENIARSKHTPLDILAGIVELRDKGYSAKEIADKTAHSFSYISGILTLLEHGEERLLTAVAQRRVPINVAMTIVKAGDDDKGVQLALQDAYESGSLRGERLEQARKLIERRKTLGRTIGNRSPRGKRAHEVSGCSLVRTYQKEVARQKLMVKKAEYAQQRLLFVIGALRSLCGDENFGHLLRAEGLDTLPAYLAERVWPNGGMA